MVSASKKKLKSSCVTLDAPVLMIHNAPKEKMAVWMDKEWLPDLIDQIKAVSYTHLTLPTKRIV